MQGGWGLFPTENAVLNTIYSSITPLSIRRVVLLGPGAPDL